MGGYVEEINKQLVGTWELDRTENFDEALEAMGELLKFYRLEKNVI
jgi:hypothetical protein